MKKIVSILISVFAVALAFAQSTTPRSGTGANNDNTFRALTFKYVAATDGTGNDTTKLNLNAYSTYVTVTVNDSTNFNFTPITRCYAGDKLTVQVKNTSGSGHKVKFVGSNVQGASGVGSITLTSAAWAVIEFVFTGTTWLETNRVVQ